MEGFESSTKYTGSEGVGDNALSWGFDGVRVSKWGDQCVKQTFRFFLIELMFWADYVHISRL
jgi:hypothetical protein